MNFNLLSRYFDPSASKEDKEKLNQWKKGNPSRQIEVEKLHTLWDESRNTKSFEDIDTETDWYFVRQKISSPYKTRHRALPIHTYIFKIAAIIILTFGLSLGLIKIIRIIDKQPTNGMAIESLGQVKSIKLPDGSIVTLNINSAIRYTPDFNQESRDLMLQGEAYFEAEHNPELPFRVYTGNSVVEVTGTRFTICEDTAFIRVLVLSGSVSFQSAENPAIGTIVSKDESGFIFRDNTLEKRQELNINNISWKTGLLVFHKTPVESAFQDIAHHFHRSLYIEANLNDSLTAQFTTQTLEDILEELRLLTSLSINQVDNIIVVKQ